MWHLFNCIHCDCKPAPNLLINKHSCLFRKTTECFHYISLHPQPIHGAMELPQLVQLLLLQLVVTYNVLPFTCSVSATNSLSCKNTATTSINVNPSPVLIATFIKFMLGSSFSLNFQEPNTYTVNASALWGQH